MFVDILVGTLLIVCLVISTAALTPPMHRRRRHRHGH
jgi:hypothetical protein